jgi:anti-anti-sigma factor
MPLNEWSESIVIAELTDEPAFSEDMESLLGSLDQDGGDEAPDVIVNMKGVTRVNSSNLSQLLRLRKRLLMADARLRVCSVHDQVWSVFLMTGLDNVFDFTEDVSTSLASLQIEEDE